MRNPNTDGCAYKQCVIFQEKLLKRAIKLQKAQNVRDEQLEKYLNKRYDQDQKDVNEAKSDKTLKTENRDPTTALERGSETERKFITDRRKIDVEQLEFLEKETFQPCLCVTPWHRVCIREFIVRFELTACPACNFEYAVGYSETYAIFNDKRRNFLRYMLW